MYLKELSDSEGDRESHLFPHNSLMIPQDFAQNIFQASNSTDCRR